jgi:hypothetical protein
MVLTPFVIAHQRHVVQFRNAHILIVVSKRRQLAMEARVARLSN